MNRARPARPTDQRQAAPRERPGVVDAWALAAELADDVAVATARDVHRAIARRVFGVTRRATGGAASGPRLLHDGISEAVYAGVGAGFKAVSAGLTSAGRRGVGPPLETGPRGRFVLSAVNGLVGDRLAERTPHLAITMGVRLRGEDVPPDPAHLAAAFPRATGDLVVFMHGLSESEDHWCRDADRLGGSYGDRLAAETSWTPVYIRANTGLPIVENGALLSRLLDRLVAGWPAKVRRIALVGHSMGGLIVRAACAVVGEAETPWTSVVTNVVTLGTPHLGAPLEKVTRLGAAGLGRFPESAPFGRILEYRSVGILNLRGGLAPDVQHLPHARYHLVAATLGGSPRSVASEVLGDLLVRYPSAVAHPRRGQAMFPEADVFHVPRANHFGLLNHPDVYPRLREWLG